MKNFHSLSKLGFKYIACTLALWVIFSQDCLAFWMKITENSDVSVYADTGTIVRVGRNKRMDVLYDLRNVDASGQRSIKSFEEFNCDTAALNPSTQWVSPIGWELEKLFAPWITNQSGFRLERTKTNNNYFISYALGSLATKS